MDDKKLQAWVDAIKNVGPDRVVVSVHGEAVTPRRAREEYNTTPNIIYIRDDGWSCGTPELFDSITQRLWSREWVVVMYRDEATGDWSWKRWNPEPKPRLIGEGTIGNAG